MESFYGLEVAAGKQVKPKIPEDHVLRLTQVALPVNANAAISLVVSLEGKQFTIATLDPKRNTFQTSTDFVLTTEQAITFSAVGAATHVT
ncbi:hypothetical protein ERJ75_000755400 [Trypanosoma vivax]|uniref:Putative nucleolar RNA-binding protein, truncated n=1 Tax=Trypanosoma vivax (strain Y486) TaxID=1055687 RepID=G0U017_TRYVY|nr:hypothetical protein ERJ75_000755400 [Trypanosoma vivax]CCC49414.1 putative nucleolar RNA-binding protein, truncated [Trypanosoma vivax Y486]